MRRFLLSITLSILLMNNESLTAVREIVPRLLKSDQISSTFIQARRFHPDQNTRDLRDLRQPAISGSTMFSSYYYSYGGPGMNQFISSQEACRLTNSFCARDYQCCSGKCRCVRWSITGKISCWKKCF